MSWLPWTDQLRQTPEHAVADLLRGAAAVAPYERAEAHEFLLAVLPRTARRVTEPLVGEPARNPVFPEHRADLPALIDRGLAAWLQTQIQTPLPTGRKLGAYAAQTCEALQWPLYFRLPLTVAALRALPQQWQAYFAKLTLSSYRDPEYDYWQVLAAHQTDSSLQFFWYGFVQEAGHIRSMRYLSLGLLALARLPLNENDSVRNLRLQAQALVSRFQRRRSAGDAALNELADQLQGLRVRNLSINGDNWLGFLREMLSPLGDERSMSVLATLGLNQKNIRQYGNAGFKAQWRLQSPAGVEETTRALQTIRQSLSLTEAWNAMWPLLQAHEDYVHKSGDPYYFVRTLDRCARALLKKNDLREPEIQARLLQWIHLSLRLEPENPRLWLLWSEALARAGQTQRSQWVLWEMTRRFPDHLPCRVELAQALAETGRAEDVQQARNLLQQVLQMDPEDLHAFSVLADLELQAKEWDEAIKWARKGLEVEDGNGPCAILLASAYERRRHEGDLEAAITYLQGFTRKYQGNLRAERYLNDLIQSQKLHSDRQRVHQAAWADETQVRTPSTGETESDPAWLSFAAQLQSWCHTEKAAVASDAAQLPPHPDRVLPLPQALRQMVLASSWDENDLDSFEPTELSAFPLETALWFYLQALQAQASLGDVNRAKNAVETILRREEEAPSYDSNFWLPFLKQRWQETVRQAGEGNIQAGTAWLVSLLDRHQPLPGVLMAA
ncbi:MULTISPECIES: tetratricopeptide repeat protein [Delftia]|uniref:tetratricopeptide repeat protein n=1 Tax=Delftia TaxID=80865 RepID=UPI000A919462|nr:tetratricopeptide repeat protein [Delftia lacustris]